MTNGSTQAPAPWLNATPPTLKAQLAEVPDLAAGYAQFLSAMQQIEGLPERPLALGRARIAQIQGSHLELEQARESGALSDADLEALRLPDRAGFSAAEEALIVVAEKLPLDPHGITDAEIETLKSLLGERPAMAAIIALSFTDVQARLQITLGTDQQTG